MPYLAAVRRSVTVFCSHVKLPGILTALLASALIAFSGEQAGSTEKWTAPAAEARKKNPVAVSESSLAAGQKIYVKRCVACHGRLIRYSVRPARWWNGIGLIEVYKLR